MTNWMAREGARLVDNGYRILPVWPGRKAPATFGAGQWRELAEWTRYCERAPTDIEIAHWSAFPDCSVGIAGGNVVGIDIDLTIANHSIRAGEIAAEMLGDTPALRFGQRPKRLLVYRTAAPFASFQAGPVQILCRGRQFVALGRHPATGGDYEWPVATLSETPVDHLPEVSEAQVRACLDAIVAILPGELRAPRVPSRSAREPATRAAIMEALDYVPLDAATSYQFWLDIGMAIHEALGGEGIDLWHHWSAGEARYEPEMLDRKWAGFGHYPGARVGAGTIFEEARRGGWTPSPGLFLRAQDAAIAAAVTVDFAAIVRSGASPSPVTPSAGEASQGGTESPGLLRSARNDGEPRWTIPPGVPGWRHNLTGGLAMFVDHADASAVSPQPWVALGAALATFGCVAGRRYAGPTGLRSNIYAIGIAGSGGGKDHPLRCCTALLAAAGLDRMVGGSKIASGSAILSALERQPCTIFPTDEIGFLMQAVADRKRASRHEAEIIGNMTELYSPAQAIFYGTAFANLKEKPRITIHQPNLCVFGVTTPQVFWSALSSAHVADGSLARFLIFETSCPYPDARDGMAASRVPAPLVDVIRQVAKGAEAHQPFPSGDCAAMAPEPFVLGYADAAAAARSREITAWQTQLLRESAGTPREAVLARLKENTFKLALIRAVAGDPLHPEITVGDLEWSFDIVEQSVATILKAVDERVADTPGEAELKRLLRIIRDGGAGGVAKSDLTRKSQWLADQRRRNALIDDLIEAGQVRAERFATSGAPKVVFYAA